MPQIAATPRTILHPLRSSKRGKIAAMSTSLRDQLLKAGLINKKQANEAERQLERRERQGPKRKQEAPREPAPPPLKAQAEKVARDQALNRKQQEKAERKARFAQIKQLIEQNRLPPVEGEEFYNFVEGNKIRRIAANASIRDRLHRSEIAIVFHGGRYDFVPAAIAARIRERDEHVFITSGVVASSTEPDETYAGYSVPDDLIW
jgi:uncharacterized protein